MDNSHTAAAADEPFVLDWGVAYAPLAGERVTGDLHVVCQHPDGALLAVIDGIGHGADAAAAARIAAATIEQYARATPADVLRACHRAMVGTRGAVVSLASVYWKEERMSWIGIGDVTGVLMEADGHAALGLNVLASRGGILGAGPEPAHDAQTTQLRPGDTLILASDGIDPAFVGAAASPQPPHALAQQIVSRFAKGTDDALVLVARFPGIGRLGAP
jgi:serine phosphatase RsbU (regulator of sigma subunit)